MIIHSFGKHHTHQKGKAHVYTVFKMLTDCSKSTHKTDCHGSKFNYQEVYLKKKKKGFPGLNE